VSPLSSAGSGATRTAESVPSAHPNVHAIHIGHRGVHLP
jgi:hypothetical protein